MPQYFWNPTTQLYEDAAGKPVPPDLVRQWIDDAILASRGRVREVSEALVAGDVNLPTWQSKLATEILHGHIATAEIASGGKTQFTREQASRLGMRVRQQFDFLERFGLQVEMGLVERGDALVSRSEMYPEATRGTYEGMRRGNHVAAGFTVERSILGGGGDSCSDCIAQQAAGWVPIGTMIPIGERQCMARCNCTAHFSTQAWES